MNRSVDNTTLECDSVKTVSVEDHYAMNLYSGIYSLYFYVVRRSRVGGASLEKYFERFPFLQEYFDQISSVMPRELTWEDGLVWWQKSLLAIEDSSDVYLPLKALRENASLNFTGRMALMLVGLMEEDSRFGTLISELQLPISARRPMLETVGQIVVTENQQLSKTPWEICTPLIDSELLQVENKELPRAEWILKVNLGAWDLIRGNYGLAQASHWQYFGIDQLSHIDELVVDDQLCSKLKNLPELVAQKRVETIILRAQEGSHSVDILSAIARESGKSTVIIKQTKSGDSKTRDSLGILCTILNAMPIFELDLAPGETVEVPKLPGFTGVKGVILGDEGGFEGIDSEQVITLSVPSPSPEHRTLMWQQYLGAQKCPDLQRISTQFRLPGDYIRQISQIAISNSALDKHDELSIEDIRVASRNLNRQKLDSLADPLEAKGQWSELITVDSTAEKLSELQQRCAYREQLLDHLGPAFNNSSNCGVRALLTGRSGTGKTLATKILAAEVGMDIYRVDLASIVNKYIGETEKNLHKVLSRAEALDVILLLDEGDALLGARTDVKNANDRYANLQTNYLLQRLENYQGVVLITTNLSDNIDKAFQRRMDIVIPFFQPQMEQRLAIFHLHLPETHLVDHNYLEDAAKYCSLMGGQIRNVCLHASLVALDEQQVVGDSHLEFALRSEYRKNGGTFPLDATLSATEFDGGMESFVQALSNV